MWTVHNLKNNACTQSGVYQLENHLGVLKTLGIKFQMPLKALLMLDIQNMKVSKAIYIFFGAGI